MEFLFSFIFREDNFKLFLLYNRFSQFALVFFEVSTGIFYSIPCFFISSVVQCVKRNRFHFYEFVSF